jgi:hypothetical protein
MAANVFKQPAAWRAGFAALVLLAASLSPALSLATGADQDFCAMECCVADGHCCCAARKPWVKGQKPDGSPTVAQTQISPQCPYSCAPSSKTSPNLRVIERPVAHDHMLAETSPTSYCDPTLIHNSSWLASTSPRAPPQIN